MRVSCLTLVALVMGLTIVSGGPVHAKKKRIGVACQGDHLHYGSSDVFKRKRTAMRDAIGAWRSWTVFEYGNEWGNWNLSRNKSVQCSRTKSKPRVWKCSISSTPCRRVKRIRKRKR